MDAADKSALKKSVDILHTVGIYGVEICKPVKTLASACEAMLQLAEIASWYKYKPIPAVAKKTVRDFGRALVGLSPEEKRGIAIAAKERVIARTLRRLEPTR